MFSNRTWSLLIIALSLNAKEPVTNNKLTDMITWQNIRTHQNKLQEIANRNQNNRMAGTNGYAESVEYIKSQMKKADYNVKTQNFSIKTQEDHLRPLLEQIEPLEITYTPNYDFYSMTGAGSGQISSVVQAVKLKIPSRHANDSNSACNKNHFNDFVKGNIALIQRGSCTFSLKVRNAIDAGARGVIIFNEGNPRRTKSFKARLSSTIKDIPVVSTSFAIGNELRNKLLHGVTQTKVLIKVDIKVEEKQVQNIIAESKSGDDKRVLVTGAHLDSVEHGPGMNDNGSGSATILEIALKFKELKQEPKNKLRFIWFAAEEMGLLGSKHYVASLNQEQKNSIFAMLNFDMLGSSNYARFVYDGDNSSKLTETSQSGPEGSGYIEKIFLDYFDGINLPSHPTSFDGRSDYGPFITAGIPAGGLFSGAEGIKSTSLARVYGGKAGHSFDPCYHKQCDDFTHTGGQEEYELAIKSLDELAKAAAHGFITLVQTEESLRPKKHYLPDIKLEYQGDILVR